MNNIAKIIFIALAGIILAGIVYISPSVFLWFGEAVYNAVHSRAAHIAVFVLICASTAVMSANFYEEFLNDSASTHKWYVIDCVRRAALHSAFYFIASLIGLVVGLWMFYASLKNGIDFGSAVTVIFALGFIYTTWQSGRIATLAMQCRERIQNDCAQ